MLEVILLHGYGGATTRQIAAVAAVNEVTLFRRFGNKQQLVRAAIERDMGESFAVEPTGEVDVDLRLALEPFCATYRDRPALPLILILETTRHPELAGLLEGPIAAQLVLREMISDFQRDGQLRPEPAESALRALLGPLVAYAIDVQLGLTDAPAPTATEIVTMWLDGHRLTADAPGSVPEASA